MQPLEIISPNFPARISAAVGKELAFDIMKEFPNVFCEKLGELPMNIPKMKIVLSENAVPFHVSTARQVPLCFQEAADKTVDDLVRSKVIIREDDPRIGVLCDSSSLSQMESMLEWSRIIIK